MDPAAANPTVELSAAPPRKGPTIAPQRGQGRFEILDSRAALDGAREKWIDLTARAFAPNLFLTWEWISSWLAVLDCPIQPLVCVAYNGAGRVIGIAPFYIAQLKLFRCVPFRCLRVLGDVSSGGEYPDLIVAKGHERAAIDLLAQAMTSVATRWDFIWLPNVAGWTGAVTRFRMLASCCEFAWRQRIRDFASARMPASLDAYLASLSANMRSTLRRQRRKAAGRPELRTDWCRGPEQIEPMLTALFELHQRRWRKQGIDGCFERQPMMVRFYRAFVPIAQQRGWLRMSAIGPAPRPHALQLGYLFSGAYYQIQEGFDPDCHDGLGNVLRADVIDACIQEGAHEYDFLAEYTDHKRRWGGALRFGSDVMIGRPAILNALILQRPLWPTGRFLRATGPAGMLDNQR